MRLSPCLCRISATPLLVSAFVLLCLPRTVSGQGEKFKPFDQRSAAELPGRLKKPFKPLAEVGKRVAPTTYVVPLRVSVRIHEIDADAAGRRKDRIRTRSYNESLCGPVIRVRPGDQLKIRLRNEISRSEWDQEYDPVNPTAPYGFNITNLHTHGLNVSPKGRADNVFLEIGPEESVELCFDIPADHPCGTFWYHAHKHGSVAMQLAGGMAGVLIVEDDIGGKGSLDDDPAIKAATRREHERILVFQQIPYRPDPTGKVVDVRWEDVYATPEEKTKRVENDRLVRSTLVNGENYPTMRMHPGEVQRWRCVHGGLEDSLDLLLVKADANGMPLDETVLTNRVPLHEIAVDGLPLGTLETWHARPLELQPGYRSDFLVQAPAPGKYVLMSPPIPAERSVTSIAQGRIHLARLEVAGAPINPPMALPKAEDLKHYPKRQGLEPIPDHAIAFKRKIDFRSNDAKKEYFVGKRAFDKNDVHFNVKLNDAEEWKLIAAAGFHPFHVHINPFEVKRTNEKGMAPTIWRDTLFISEESDSPALVRIRFKGFGGKTVLHCHNLRHEDQGMMAVWQVDGHDRCLTCPQEAVGLKAGTPVPDWTMLDADSKPRRKADFQGKKLLMVFSRGSDCVHCRAQVKALEAIEQKLKAAGLTVIVVAPVAPAKLPGTNFPFVALSDEDRVAFEDFGCFPGRAVHGTYLIDTAGVVRWADAGDEPFMSVETLPAKAGELK